MSDAVYVNRGTYRATRKYSVLLLTSVIKSSVSTEKDSDRKPCFLPRSVYNITTVRNLRRRERDALGAEGALLAELATE